MEELGKGLEGDFGADLGVFRGTGGSHKPSFRGRERCRNIEWEGGLVLLSIAGDAG